MNELLEYIDDVESFSFLLVDDRANMRRTIRNMLRTYGLCNFGDADDGDVAIKKLKTQYYDFIICDWNMPRMKGVQFLRLIREDEELSEIPFLMITGEATQDKIAEVIEAGVDGYLLKPFDIRSLENKIVEILKVRKSEPLPLEAQILLAEHYSQVGCYWQSNQELEKAAEINCYNPRVHYMRGVNYEAEGDDSKAEEAFQTARQHSPTFVKAYDRLADIYLKRGQEEQSLEMLERAARISPNNADRQKKLGQGLIAQGRKEEGARALNRAMTLKPGDIDLMKSTGDAFILAGHPQAAEKVLRDCIASDPNGIYAYNRLGIALRRQNKFVEAVECYCKALEIAPEDENLHFNLARAYIEANNNKSALEHLKTAIRIRPEFNQARGVGAEVDWRQMMLARALPEAGSPFFIPRVWRK